MLNGDDSLTPGLQPFNNNNIFYLNMVGFKANIANGAV